MKYTKTINITLFLVIILTFVNIIKALPENTKCENICRNANRGCTNNCTKSGGSEKVCGNLCNDRYKGCFYKCLYDNNCSK